MFRRNSASEEIQVLTEDHDEELLAGHISLD